ncbi:sterile20-like kinase [Anaeramoeba flamelloides]|uniref:non-specific serine/threonine protein kinase n=1 Tax=Anaeramoeba flamelloides TaxID=1746091 RepID=A0ABQ8X730_9EUKA|nr:sterile20-like kinase [Anaeramoeba flamelloides]
MEKIKNILGISNVDPNKLFELIEILGKGSYGSVYKGKQKGTGEIVAIKMIEYIEEDEGLYELKCEIDILKKCKQKNIVRYFGTYFKDSTIWIVMEYCGGGSLSDICQILEHGLNEKQISAIMYGALEGLNYFHSNKIIHRDIKGGNILLTDQGKAKIADFGVSAQLKHSMSKRNTFIGTIYWMAPEVVLDYGQYDSRADIWSLGITAIEAAEILPPLSNLEQMRVVFIIPNEKTQPPELKNKEQYSDEFNDFISKCLHPFIQMGKTNYNSNVLLDLIHEVDSIVSERGYRFKIKSDESLTENEDETESSEGSVKYYGNYNSNGYLSSNSEESESDSEGSMAIYDNSYIQKDNIQAKESNFNWSIVLQENDKGTKGIQKSLEQTGLSQKIENLKKKNSIIDIPFLNLSTMDFDSFFYKDEENSENSDPLETKYSDDDDDDSGDESEHEEAKHLEILKELTDQEIVLEKSMVTPSISNLIKMLKYNLDKMENVPMITNEIEQTNKNISELTTIIKTILKFKKIDN